MIAVSVTSSDKLALVSLKESAVCYYSDVKSVQSDVYVNVRTFMEIEMNEIIRHFFNLFNFETVLLVILRYKELMYCALQYRDSINFKY